MTSTGMIGYVCLIPFNFNDKNYIEISENVIDYGMGLTVEYLFECAFNIMLELKNIDDIIAYLDATVFPEHVPNDSLNTCINLCVNSINYFIDKLVRFKHHLNIMVFEVYNVTMVEANSTLSFNFNMYSKGEIWNTSYLQKNQYAN